MNNDLNLIMGIGIIVNTHSRGIKHNTYNNYDYNRYNYSGKIRLSSESGVNIKLKDAGSGTATNMMFSTATDIHGEEITHSSGTFTAFGNITLTSADGSPIKIDGTTADIAHLGLKQQSQELR